MIIFLYGNDAFRSWEKLMALKAAYTRKNAESAGLFEFDFSSDADTQARNFFHSLEEQGLFASKKLVIAKRLFSAPEGVRKSVAEFLEKHVATLEADQDRVLAIWEDAMPKKSMVLFKLLSARVAKQQCFDSLRGVQLEHWITRRVREKNALASIEKAAAALLAVEMEGDLYRLDNELEKLVNFRNGEIIRLSDVKLFVENSAKSNVFEALEALSLGKKSLALQVFAEERKKGENDLKLLSMCAWQLRNLLRASEAYTQGIRTAPLLAKQLKVHPFVAQKLLRQVSAFPVSRLKQGFSLLAELDRSSKTGTMDPKLALDMFVVKF